MVKRKGSITIIVNVKEGGDLRVGGMVASREMTERVMGHRNVPRSDYKVTYEINGKGNFECYQQWDMGNTRIKNIRTKRERIVCFLPNYFVGHRLKRKVEIIKKRGEK